MGREELCKECCIHLAPVAGKTDVILLIYRLQLCVEAADNHILEAVTLNLCPSVQLIRWNILYIASYVIRSVGVCTLTTDGSHHLVVLVRDVVAGCEL